MEQFYTLEKLQWGDVKVLDIPPHERQLEWEQWMRRQVLPSFNPFKHPEAADRIAWMYKRLQEEEGRA